MNIRKNTHIQTEENSCHHILSQSFNQYALLWTIHVFAYFLENIVLDVELKQKVTAF